MGIGYASESKWRLAKNEFASGEITGWSAKARLLFEFWSTRKQRTVRQFISLWRDQNTDMLQPLVLVLRRATYLKETQLINAHSHAFQERMTFVLVPQQPQSLIMVWRVLSLSRNSVCNFPGRRRKHFVLECKDRWMACVYWGMGRNLCKLEVNGAGGKLLMLLTGRNQRHLCCNSCMNRAEKWQALCMIHLKILTNACGVTSQSFRTHGCRDVIPGVRTREFIELQSRGFELRVRPGISCRFRRTSGKVAGTVARFAMFLNLPTWTVARCENKRSYFCFLSTDG